MCAGGEGGGGRGFSRLAGLTCHKEIKNDSLFYSGCRESIVRERGSCRMQSTAKFARGVYMGGGGVEEGNKKE